MPASSTSLPSFWLLKSEPETWSWEDQKTQKTTAWDGVRNYQAAGNMKKMRVGDLAFFYHSGSERKIVGIVRITKPYYPDPTDLSHRFGMVDVTFEKTLNDPIPLARIKSETCLEHLALVRQSRLSVMPIDENSWKYLCMLGKTSAP
ncbi:MAG: EVE domain-containing protein [Proteobacteria bacterium]|nr:EVE domain-containing protein [Pseudomonadota bacterium]